MFAPVRGNEPVEISATFPSLIKETKPQARRELLASADDDLIKGIVECVINTLNRNDKLTKDEKIK